MAGSDPVEAVAIGVIEEVFELDVFVAQDVGVGGAAFLVIAQKRRKDLIPVLGDEIDPMQGKPEFSGDG